MSYSNDEKHLITQALKMHHDAFFASGKYDQSVFGRAALIIEEEIKTAKPGNWIYDNGTDEDGNVQAHCSVCGAGDKHASCMVGHVPYCWKCGGPRPDSFQKANDPVSYVDALTVLDEMDKYRRDCHINGRTDTDFAMRKACQIIASAAGYADRASWMNAIDASAETAPQVKGKAVAVVVLSQIESWRSKHASDPQSVDYALRYAEAVVASNADYRERLAWTGLLQHDPRTTYSRDYSNPEYPTWVW